MANKKAANSKKPTQTSDEPKITRIKAKDTTAKTKTVAKKTAEPVTVTAKSKVASKSKASQSAESKPTSKALKPLVSIKNYFAGAWYELKQVHWPDRKATWGMTLAVILFSAFFIGLIILLDFAFQKLFETVIL